MSGGATKTKTAGSPSFRTPERPDSTSRVPLLKVVHLLLDLLELGFHLDRAGGDRRVVSFGRDGVRLASHFLRQEVQPPAHRAVGRDDLAELRDVGGEA